MQTHLKIRMEILIEAPLRSRLSALLESHEVSGYTIFPAMGGSGGMGDWSRAGMITDFGQMLLFTCILDPGKQDEILTELRDRLADHIGYVTVTEVGVVRPNKFT